MVEDRGCSKKDKGICGDGQPFGGAEEKGTSDTEWLAAPAPALACSLHNGYTCRRESRVGAFIASKEAPLGFAKHYVALSVVGLRFPSAKIGKKS